MLGTAGLNLGTGVRTVATQKVFTQGNIVQTGNALDIAVQGKGFFEILMPDGSTAYSRDGSFQVDSNGQMVTANGYQLQPGITIPNDAISVTIGEDGIVTVQVAGNANASMQDALASGDAERADHEFRKIGVALTKARQFKAEADACSGGDGVTPGVTEVEVTNEGLSESDDTEQIDDGNTGVGDEPPGTSPFE